jgi:hypothetical protein
MGWSSRSPKFPLFGYIIPIIPDGLAVMTGYLGYNTYRNPDQGLIRTLRITLTFFVRSFNQSFHSVG